MLTHLDLFSGIGGFSLASSWAGFETIQFVEKDKFCQRVLRKHWPDVQIHDDIKTFEPDYSVDLLTGGFPCQPFSIAGKKKGVKDDRYLWPEMLRVIRRCRPFWIVAENVPGIIPIALDGVLMDLAKEGYTTESFIIPASAVGAPHKRERIWIIAYSDSARFLMRRRFGGEGQIQDNINWNLSQIQPEWSQCIPKSWATFNAENWFKSSANSDGYECDKGTENHDAESFRSEWENPSAKDVSFRPFDGWEENQPPVPGVDDGLPNGLDRNRALGNAIVPQVVYPILRFIYQMEKAHER